MKKFKSKFTKLLKNRLIKNFCVIFTGQGIASVFGLLGTIIIIKAIGSEKHGILVIAETYGTLFFNFFSFKTFQALIKYLAKSLKEKNYIKAKEYIKWSFLLDVFSIVLAVIAGLVFMNLMLRIMDWDNNVKIYAIIYTLLLITNIQGSTIGILRTFDKYDYVMIGQIANSVIKFLGWGILWYIKGNLFSYFIVMMIGFVVNNIILIIMSLYTLKKNKLLDFYKVKLTFDKEFLKFNLFSNLASTIDLPINQVSQLIINKYLGFSANSVYSVFNKLGTIINKLGDPLSQIIYPEMNSLIAENKNKEAKKISDKLKVLMLGLFAILSVFVLVSHKYWLGLFMDNPNAYVLGFIIYLAYISYTNGTSGVHSLFLALGYIKYTIPIVFIINIIYLAIIFFAVQWFGLNGVLLSYLIQAMGVVLVKEVIMKKNNYEEYRAKEE